MNQIWQYPFAINSVADAHPALAHYLGAYNVYNVQAQKQAGELFDPLAAYEAERTVQAFHSMSSHDLNITPAVLNTAINRAHLLRQFDMAQQFPNAANLAGLQMQMNERLDRIVALITAQTTNTRTLIFNHLISGEVGFRPLVKEVPGSGLALALQAAPPGLPLPQQLVALQMNAAAGNAIPAANLGQAPPFYDANLDGYRHEDILRLIEFYNDNFGIIAGDGLPVRKAKLRAWMRVR